MGKVAAASSAAAAPFGSPHAFDAAAATLLATPDRRLDLPLPSVLMRSAYDLLDSLGPNVAAACPRAGAGTMRAVLARGACALRAHPLLLAEAAVCTHAVDAGGHCAFPATRVGDGGYVDHFGAAQTVSALQRRAGGARRTLMLLLTGNQECDGPPTNRPACGQPRVAGLFARAPNRPVSAGEPVARLVGVTAPSEQIFAAAWDEVAAQLRPLSRTPRRDDDGDRQPRRRGQRGAEPSGAGERAGAGRRSPPPPPPPPIVWAARVRTSTVRNAAYGVDAGTDADVLLLIADAPIGNVGLYGERALSAELLSAGAYATAIDESGIGPLVAAWRAGGSAADSALPPLPAETGAPALYENYTHTPRARVRAAPEKPSAAADGAFSRLAAALAAVSTLDEQALDAEVRE